MQPHTPASFHNLSVAPDDDDTLLTRGQVAQILGIAVPTLERWASSGIGPRVTKIGPRRVCYRKGDVRAFIKAGRQPAASS